MSAPDLKHIINRRGDVVEVDLHYPRVEGNDQAIEINLMDVRAADNIRVTYDHDRDGWVISMLRTQAHDDQGNAYVVEPPTWVEQAFIEAQAAMLPLDGKDAT